MAKIDNFGKIVLVYAILTHVFEWRQAVSMLNPTSILAAFGNSAHEIGDGLRQRRKWLLDSLESFSECYWTQDTATAASLLHQLAYVSLNVSLSDLLLAAGRSGNKEDGEVAEDVLRHWANSENVDDTMDHVLVMLEIAHRALESRAAADSSFEVATCLFTGGIVCWAYTKLHDNTSDRDFRAQVGRASNALREMGCWRMCAMFGAILLGFEGNF